MRIRSTPTHAWEAFLPLAGLIACLAGRAEAAAALLGAYLLERLCALCPDAAYLSAAADELNVRGLTRLRKTAVLLLLAGVALAALAVWFFLRPLDVMEDSLLALYGAAAVLALGCRLFVVILAAQRHRRAAFLLEGLLAALLLAAMLLGDPGWSFTDAFWADVSRDAPLYCAVAGLMACLAGGFAVGRLAPAAVFGPEPLAAKLFARAPLALLRTLLCPALLAALTWLCGPALLPAAFAGWALFGAGSSLFRRTDRETPPLALALVTGAALLQAGVAAVMLLGDAVPLPALRDLAEARLYGVPCAALPIALAALLCLLFNASMTPYLAVSMALLAGQAALICLPALGSLSGSALSLAAGGLAIASVAPLIRELPAVRAKLGAARARRSRRAS